MILSTVYGKGFATTARKTLDRTVMVRDPVSAKEVVLVPMVHVGRERDYLKIAAYLDRLKNDGYVTFVEGTMPTYVSMDTIDGVPCSILLDTVANMRYYPSDSTVMDTLSRKFRRAFGICPENWNENMLINSRIRKATYAAIGLLHLTTDKDLWVDYTLKDLIDLYESRFGEIKLSDYDYYTDILEPYNIKGTNIWRILWIRNDHLLSMILNSEYQKIAVVWGAAHTRDMKWELCSVRHGYEKVKVKVPKEILYHGHNGADSSGARVR